jgi:acyl carrier protein
MTHEIPQGPEQTPPYRLVVGGFIVPDAMTQKRYDEFKAVIADELAVQPEQVTDTAIFYGDGEGQLGADSLDLATLMLEFQEQTGLKVDEDDEHLITRVHHVRDYFNVTTLNNPTVFNAWKQQREREIDEFQKKQK